MYSNTSSRHPVITKAIDAMNAHDADALAALFVDGGSVEDDNERFEGRTAIREWFEATPAIRLESLGVEPSDPGYVVKATAHGDYPQSPLPFRYSFVLQGDRIGALMISLL